MPTYEYACRSCGRHFEVVQSFSEEPLTECRECGGDLRRVFHPVGVLFKGSGFYSTDAKRASSKPERSAGADTKKAASSDGKAASKEASRSDASGSSSEGSGAGGKPSKAAGSGGNKD